MLQRSRTFLAALFVLSLCACGVSRAKLSALEVTAIRDVKDLQAAQVQYSAQFGRFAANLSELRTADLIPATLASGEKDGYKFTMTGSQKAFTINASPKVFGETGG